MDNRVKINDIATEWMSGGFHGSDIGCGSERSEKAFAAMKEIYALTISPADDWIPCAERLPKEHKRGTIMCSDLVAVTVKNSTRGTVYTAVDYTVNGKWETYEVMETGCTVLAWQPLPAPWAGEKKGEADGK